MVELVEELEKSNPSNKYDEMIVEAKAGEYHDYKNEKYACGKMALVSKLHAFPELANLRDRVINGEFDEEPDETDKTDLKEMLIKNNAEHLIPMLGLD